MGLYLRKTVREDAALLYRWRNDAAARANSFHTEEIPYDVHVRWLDDVLSDTAQSLYVLCEDGVPVGQARLCAEDGVGTISYSIDAAYRAQGYGRALLTLLENLCAAGGTVRALRGCVKRKNIASQMIFETLGYMRAEASEKEYLIYEKRTLEDHSFEAERKSAGGVLLLTNNRNALPLYEWLQNHGEAAVIYSGRISPEMLDALKPRWIVSCNYAYIVPREIIDRMRGRMVNLHASLLPWNRGASPNFWSFVEDTPKGVSIHFMDEGLDTGELIAQEEVFFDETQETFRSTYQVLHERMLRLFYQVWPFLAEGRVRGRRQEGTGSFHTRKDLQVLLSEQGLDWDMNIAAFKRRMRSGGDCAAKEKKAADYRGAERQS